MTQKILVFFALVLTAAAAETASFDSAGELTSLIQNGGELPIHSGLYATFTGGLVAPLQPHDQRSPITRDGDALSWKGTATFPNTAQAKFTVDWTATGPTLKLNASASTERPLDLASLDYVIDLPRDVFEGGSYGDDHRPFPSVKPTDVSFFQETTDHLSFSDRGQTWKITLSLDHARLVRIVDRWDNTGRSYRVHIVLHSGFVPPASTISLGLTVTTEAHPAALPVALAIHPAETIGRFDGFGANFRLEQKTPPALVDFLFKELQPAWARAEFKASFWDREHASPGAELKRDFAFMQKIQQAGIPWVLSLWRLPERYYTDPNQKPFGAFGRQIAPDRWPEFLELLGSYLKYLKTEYQAEPDYFSFNESDLGVNVGFTADTQRDMIKKVGAHLASLGLKTKMLLGDTANPRDSHLYNLPTAADSNAMRYVGALSVHSWGNGTSAQYRAWASLGDWLNIPFIVGEAGTDPGSWRNHTFDSYTYGLKEIQQYQELLREMHPTAILYWQYTEDYGLARMNADGVVEPSGRFWLMKHFAVLSPRKGQLIGSSSDQKDTLISAFSSDHTLSVHILNLGPERDALVTGLPSGNWKIITTTEAENFVSRDAGETPAKLHLPARSFVTLIKSD